MVMSPIILVMAVSFSARNGASAVLGAAGPPAHTAQGTPNIAKAAAANVERAIERAMQGMERPPISRSDEQYKANTGGWKSIPWNLHPYTSNEVHPLLNPLASRIKRR
jgi:hypothetical protein